MAWSSGVRLGRLWPAWRGQAADWLLAVDLRDRTVGLEEDLALASVLREMALLGLRPQVLVTSPQESPVTAHFDAPAAPAPVPRGSG